MSAMDELLRLRRTPPILVLPKRPPPRFAPPKRGVQVAGAAGLREPVPHRELSQKLEASATIDAASRGGAVR